ncbi:MAG TPA: DUF924 family protein [Luteimonas sp.]|nr:DUF924 family protein [Luteimonas sp.]
MAIANVEPAWVGDVLRFWFEELSETHWFAKNDDVDARIRDRFLALHERLVTENGLGATAPRSMLAVVIVLDQFSRNLFRGDPRAYAADPVARQISRAAIEQGFDTAMTKQERRFLYLPFEHSEDHEDQALSLDLIKTLGNEEWTHDAIAHKIIIDRFGRFPHRNAVLNRLSTPDEIELLKEPMRAF